MKDDGGTDDLSMPNEEGDESKEPLFRIDPSLAASIAEIAMRMQEGCSGIGKAFQEIASVARRCGQMMARAVAVDTKSLYESLIKFQDGLNAFIELNPPKKMASDYGWPPMFDMDFAYLADIYIRTQEIESEGDRRDYVDEKFKAYYQGPELDRLLAGWRDADCLKATGRLLIIEDAFQAYKEGKYSIASPAILAQTEGLFFEKLSDGDDETPISKTDYKKLCQKLKEEEGDGSIVVFVAEALTAFVCGYGLYRSKGKPDQGHRDLTAYDVSRHKILHGSSTEYCSHEEISLRHLLWLDGVVQVVELISNRGEAET